ncbi:hypothetical protein DL96DRAFT_773560, partial [Flagelloscypha sp. PMI_526]
MINSPEPILPPEIELSIFHFCAQSNPRMVPVLIQVSQRVKTWIEPLRFRQLYFKRNKATHLITLVKWKEADSLAQHVQYFVIGAGISYPEHILITSILPHCAGMRDLALFTGVQNHTYACLPSFPQLRYLTLCHRYVNYFVRFLRENPSFTLQITHLHSDWDSLVSLESLVPFQLPNLTHMAGEWLESEYRAQLMDKRVEIVARMLEYGQIQCIVLSIPRSSLSGCRTGLIWNHPKVIQLEIAVAGAFEAEWICKNGSLRFWETIESKVKKF